MDVCHQGWHVPLSTITNRQTYKSWCNFATWPKKFQRRWSGDAVFFHFLRLVLTCWHLGKGENAIHFVSCHQERTKTVCLFLSLRVVKRVRWCIFIFNKWISTSWVVEDTRLCLSKIVAFTQSRHEELSPKTQSLYHRQFWIHGKCFFIIVFLVEMSFIYSKHHSPAGAAHMAIKDSSDFVLPVQKFKEGKETETVQHCRKIQHNFLTYHGFYPHKKGGSLPVESGFWPSRSRLWGDQIQNDCSPFLAETDNLLSNTLPAAKDHQRPMRSLWGVWHWKSVQSIINVNWRTWYQFCDSVGPLASLSFWILSFRLTELHLFISDVFAMNLL